MTSAALESVQAVTFDMYGTLLDLGATFGPGFSEFLRAKGSSRDAAEIVQLWETVYLRESMVDTMLGRGRTLFQQIRRQCLCQVFSHLGIAYTRDEIEELLTTHARVSLFPDVQEGLQALRGKFTLAVLSNGDLAALEGAVSDLAIPVDRIISAEQAGVYKPHSAVYNAATQNLNLPPNRMLHVAAHPWDVRGAMASGFLGAYVNRDNVPFYEAPPQPDLEVSRLTDLASGLGV